MELEADSLYRAIFKYKAEQVCGSGDYRHFPAIQNDSVITVTGDTLAEGTSVSVVINGVTIGTVAINSSGSGTLIVPTSSISTTVAAGSTVSVGTLNGTFAASTSTGSSGSSGSSGFGHFGHFGQGRR